MLPRAPSYNWLGSVPVSTPTAQTGQEFVRDYAADRLGEKQARDLEKSQSVDLLLGPSVQVTLPVWDRNQAQIAKARFRMLQKEKECEEMLQTVITEVVQAAAAARTSDEIVRFYATEALALAGHNVETATRTYEAGEEDILALLDAQKSLIRQREAYVDALAQSSAGGWPPSSTRLAGPSRRRAAMMLRRASSAR